MACVGTSLMIGHGQRPAAKETNEKREVGEWCVPERSVNAAPGQEHTNQAAIVGTNVPNRSNWDCIRPSLLDHSRPHEIGGKRCRSDDDPAQCFDFQRLS
jgi:hypothetical protein